MEDQCVITRQVTVAAGVFAPGHLGELTQIVPFEMVDQALAATGTAQARVRVLPSRVVVYLLLAGCLFAELGYRQVWHKLTAGLGSCRWPTRATTRCGRPAPAWALRRCGGCSICCAARPRRSLPGRCAGAGCWCAPSTAPRWPSRTAPGTWRLTASRPAATAGRATRCCGWWPWWPAAPAPSSTRCSGPPAAASWTTPAGCCAACTPACSCCWTATLTPPR